MLQEFLKEHGPMKRMTAEAAGKSVEEMVNTRIRHEKLNLLVTYEAQVFSICSCVGVPYSTIPMVHGEVMLCD